MAKGKKTGGKNIKPGQILNPTGKGGVDPEKTALRKLTKEQVHEMGALVLKRRYGDVKRIARSNERSTLQVWIANIAVSGVVSGSVEKLDILLDRLIGKVKTDIDLTINDDRKKPVAELDAELEELKKLQELENS